jgi:hypothetical protein
MVAAGNVAVQPSGQWTNVVKRDAVPREYLRFDLSYSNDHGVYASFHEDLIDKHDHGLFMLMFDCLTGFKDRPVAIPGFEIHEIITQMNEMRIKEGSRINACLREWCYSSLKFTELCRHIDAAHVSVIVRAIDDAELVTIYDALLERSLITVGIVAVKPTPIQKDDDEAYASALDSLALS